MGVSRRDEARGTGYALPVSVRYERLLRRPLFSQMGAFHILRNLRAWIPLDRVRDEP